MKKLTLSFLALCLLVIGISAQNEPAQISKWKVDDVVMTESAGQFEVSPDGRWAVWVKTVADKEKDGRVSNLMLSSLTEKKEIELTRGVESNNSNPKWSPNGQLIAFVSTRPVPRKSGAPPAPPPSPGDGPRPQLWLFNPFGGEPWNLTGFERGVTNYEWLDDDTIIFAAPEDPTNYEKTIKEKKDGTLIVEDAENTPPVRLFKFSIKAKKYVRLSNNDDWIQSFAVSRDGSKVLAIHNRSLRYVYDQKVKPVAILHDLKTGEQKPLYPDGKPFVSSVRAARESNGFYLTSPYSNDPVYLNAAITLLYFYDAEGGATTQVPLDWENGLSFGMDVTNDGFIALLADGARNRPARYTRTGSTWRRTLIEGEHARNIFGFELGKDGRTLLYSYSTPSAPPQWFKASLDGSAVKDPIQLTDVNPHFKGRVKAKSEVVRWKGANDEEVEGILYFPHNYEAGKKFPLMLMIHGGPHGADLDAWAESWASPTNLVCERGAFVLKPNYHGSSNYGLKWGESIGGGKYYDLEIPDAEKGVDYLISRGLVDPDRVGTMGWSNGSIISTALTVHNPARYKVCGSGAGNVEWASDWANAVFGASFDNYYFGKSALEDPMLYFKKSPYYQMHKVRTPTIILHGTNDNSVPTSQSWMHYRALQQLGLTPVRLVLFPGEPHGLQKLSHQRRKVEEELAWFDKHLFKTLKEENKAFKPESPLAMAFKQSGFRKTGANFGAPANGKLIPEIVKQGKVELGRFEITRAQFAAFDPAYKIDAGTENYPANNVSFEQARAYCEWLSKLTGQPYRLANQEEVEAIYDSAKAGENTLDYWAGYAVNPDDAARLQAKLKELGEDAPLLKPVGSFKASGDELVYDLGGNVAEWAIGKDGQGIALGGSADQTQDDKRAKRAATPAYTGFRVVKGNGGKVASN